MIRIICLESQNSTFYKLQTNLQHKSELGRENLDRIDGISQVQKRSLRKRLEWNVQNLLHDEKLRLMFAKFINIFKDLKQHLLILDFFPLSIVINLKASPFITVCYCVMCTRTNYGSRRAPGSQRQGQVTYVFLLNTRK